MNDCKKELLTILNEIGAVNIWRPVYDDCNVLLAAGTEDMRDGAIRDLSLVDFRGRTVLDLGCNLGFYTFLAKRLGASEALGVDRDDQAVRACDLLRRLKRLDQGARFMSADFMTDDIGGPFDICLMINFMGVQAVAQGMAPFLDRAAALTRETMVFTARPVYRLKKHFGDRASKVARTYPEEFVRNGRFFMMEYMTDYFSDGWNMRVLSPDYENIDIRRTIIFTKIESEKTENETK